MARSFCGRSVLQDLDRHIALDAKGLGNGRGRHPDIDAVAKTLVHAVMHDEHFITEQGWDADAGAELQEVRRDHTVIDMTAIGGDERG